MKKNRIIVFNRLVDNKLQDVEFFEELLQDHYRKFTLGYNILSSGNILEDVQDVQCEFKKSKMDFIVSFENPIDESTLIELNRVTNDVICDYDRLMIDFVFKDNGSTLIMKISKRQKD